MPDQADATPEEAEAVGLRWHAQHPDAEPGAGPNPEEFLTLLDEVRTRAAAIEQAALDMLAQATRNAPSRSGANSKYMVFFWFGFVPILALILLAAYLYETISRAR